MVSSSVRRVKKRLRNSFRHSMRHSLCHSLRHSFPQSFRQSLRTGNAGDRGHFCVLKNFDTERINAVPEPLIGLEAQQSLVPLLSVESVVIGCMLPAIIDHNPPRLHTALLERRQSSKHSCIASKNGMYSCLSTNYFSTLLRHIIILYCCPVL